MRFVMINLILVCLLLFGIGYLAFGNVETDPNPEPNAHASIHCADVSPLDRISRNVQGTPQNGVVACSTLENLLYVCLPDKIKRQSNA